MTNMTGPELYSIDYLASGSNRQKRAYRVLTELALFSRLESLSESPAVLVGSIPNDLALEDSDLNIVTMFHDLKSFSTQLRENFGHHQCYTSERGIALGVSTLMTRFDFEGEHFTIQTQHLPIASQNAVIHMLIESRLLAMGGVGFTNALQALRAQGLKTEPAFAKVLGLTGDPYSELIELEERSDLELRRLFEHCF